MDDGMSFGQTLKEIRIADHTLMGIHDALHTTTYGFVLAVKAGNAVAKEVLTKWCDDHPDQPRPPCICGV